MILIAAVCCLGTIRGKEDPSAAATNDRKLYADKVHQTYNFVFGADDISSPGNAAVEGKEFLPASAYPDAEYCGHCHQEAYHQWREALHSNSFRTPFYRASVNILSAPRASNSPAIATVATTRLAFWPEPSTKTQPWIARSTAMASPA